MKIRILKRGTDGSWMTDTIQEVNRIMQRQMMDEEGELMGWNYRGELVWYDGCNYFTVLR